MMTIQDIVNMDKDFLTPAEVADVLQCSPQLIRTQAERRPELLGFHFCKVGNRIKIPRESFICWMKEFVWHPSNVGSEVMICQSPKHEEMERVQPTNGAAHGQRKW